MAKNTGTPLHDACQPWKQDLTNDAAAGAGGGGVCGAGLQGGLILNNTGNYYPALRITGMKAGQAVSLDDIEVSSGRG